MTRVGSWNLQIVYRPAASDGFAGAFAESIIYGHRDLGEHDRAAISWKNLLASVSFLATGDSGQRGFPSVRHAESFEDAGEIVGAPAVTQYERSRDGLWVLAHLQFSLATSRATPRGRRPRTAPRGEPPSRTATTGAKRSRKPPNERPEVEHPGASVSSLRLSEQGYVGSCPREGRDLSAPTSERVWAILSRATFDARAWALLGLATVRRI